MISNNVCILICVDSDKHLKPPFKLRNSNCCSDSSLTLIEHSSDLQRLWSDCAYVQAGLRLCWSHIPHTGPRSAVGNVSGYRCVSDCTSRGREFDPGPVPYFRGDWSWNNFYGHSLPFRWFIQEGLLSVTSESMCTNYWLTACSSLPRKNVWISKLTVPQWP